MIVQALAESRSSCTGSMSLFGSQDFRKEAVGKEGSGGDRVSMLVCHSIAEGDSGLCKPPFSILPLPWPSKMRTGMREGFCQW